MEIVGVDKLDVDELRPRRTKPRRQQLEPTRGSRKSAKVKPERLHSTIKWPGERRSTGGRDVDEPNVAVGERREHFRGAHRSGRKLVSRKEAVRVARRAASSSFPGRQTVKYGYFRGHTL